MLHILGVRRQPGQKDAGGRGDLAVVLAHKAPEQFRGVLKTQARPVEGSSIRHSAAPHKDNAESKPLVSRKEAHGIHVAATGQHGGLTLHRALHGANLITQNGGFFKFQIFRCPVHCYAQAVHQGRGASLQEITDLADVFIIFLRRYHVHAGRGALSHKMIQACAHAVFHGFVGAAAQGKSAVDDLPRFTRRQRRSERPEIARAVAPGLTNDFKPGKVVFGVQPEEHVLLVVAQHNVIARPVLFDEAGLKEQSFFFRGGGEVFYACGMGKHGPGFGRQSVRPEVGKHAPPQHTRLANVDDAAPFILVEVNAGRKGDG